LPRHAPQEAEVFWFFFSKKTKRKIFFFEKKKQKTFIFALVSGAVHFGVAGLVQAVCAQYIRVIDKGRLRCFGPLSAAAKEF